MFAGPSNISLPAPKINESSRDQQSQPQPSIAATMVVEKGDSPGDTRPFALRVPVPVLHSNAAVAPQDDSVPVELEDHHRELEGEFTHQTELPPNYDIEYDRRKPWTRYPMGYPRFAAFIANDEDRSTTIFRRFQRLSSRNLLYLESELAYLEAEQDRLDQESRKSHELTLSMKSWNLLCLQATPPREQPKGESEQDARRRLQLEGAAQERLQLAWRIREVLATYREPRCISQFFKQKTNLVNLQTNH